MKEYIQNNRKQLAKNIVLAGLFLLLMINWNFHRIQLIAEKWNPVFMAVMLTIVLAISCELKPLIKDKWFIAVFIINLVAVINMTIVGTGYYSVVPLYCLTLGLYLADKLEFTKKDVLFFSILMGMFFFYWTFDVKGYFKGYTINYGGLVLISGFVSVAFLLEYLRYFVLKTGNKDNAVIAFIRKYPYIITAFEVFMFLWAYNIISWYRSRTAFFALIALGIMMIIPRKTYKSKAVFTLVTLAVIIGGFVFPVAYVYVGSRVNIVDYQMFYKTLFSSRLPVWRDLFGIYKSFMLTGIGTIYPSNEIYRQGLLDSMNVYIGLLVVYGPIVCIGVISLLVRTILVTMGKVSDNQLTKMMYAGIVTMLVASYGENMLLTVPFSLIFVLTVSIAGNIGREECLSVSESYKAIDFGYYKKLFANGKGYKLLASILAVLLPLFLVMILGPVEVYYANYDEFSFTNYDYFFIFLALCIIILIIAATIVSVLPDGINKVIVSGLTALSVASYVQYMFLNKNLIMEDGEFLEAEALGNYPLITLCIYAGVFLVICIILTVFRKRTYEIVSGLSGFILAITLVATLSLFLTHITSKKERLWYSGADEFKVAPGENVIVIVPDTFGRTALDLMLKQYPDAVDFLNDFTFYENEDSRFFPTYPALHHMLTAYPYDESMTRYEYTRDAFESEEAHSFFDELHDNDFTVRLYTRDVLFEQVTTGLVDNIEEAHITIDRKSLFKFLYNMSMYRYVPYVLKADFAVDTMALENINQYNGIGPYHFNSDFYSAMQEQGITVDESINNAFIMHHIRGTHMPYISNANNEMVEANSVSGEETSYGTMRLIEDYLKRLKAIDKYDDSTVIIVADHGFYDTDSIFYIKRKNEHHDAISVNSDKISHDDFQDIVLNEIR